MSCSTYSETYSKELIFFFFFKRDGEYYRKYRKRKYLDNGIVRITTYVDKELRDRFKEILRDANMTYSEWFENAIKVEILGGVCQ